MYLLRKPYSRKAPHGANISPILGRLPTELFNFTGSDYSDQIPGASLPLVLRSGTIFASSAGGGGILCDGTTTGASRAQTARIDFTKDFLVCCVLVPSSTANGSDGWAISFGSGTAMLFGIIRPSANGKAVRLFFRDDGSTIGYDVTSSVNIFSVGSPTAICASRSNGRARIWANGQLVIDTSIAATGASTAQYEGFGFLARGSYELPWAGIIPLMWSAQMGASAEIGRDLSINPWQIYRKRIVMPFDNVAGGAAFQPAWAANSTVTIQSARAA